MPVATISSINKTTLNVGDTLIITGQNFNADPSKDLVSIASVAYKVISASATQLVLIVPKGAQSGNLTIAFNGGQATTYSQTITIVGSTAPVIKSITPTAGAYEGDTVVVKGKNLGIPYSSNAITFNGIKATIYNVSDSVMRVVIPNLASTGPVQLTANGVNSPTFQYTILKVDPNADGHLYWMMPLTTLNYNTYTYVNTEDVFVKGTSNVTTPQSSLIYDLVNNNGIYPPNPDPYSYVYSYPESPSYAIDNLVVNDAQDKYGYYLTANSYPFPATYTLMRLSLTGAATSPAAVWTQTYTQPVYTTFTANGGSAALNYIPDQEFTADGNTAYIKMGVSDDYLVGDLSASSPNFTLQKNVFGDPLAYEPKFGKDYVFFQEIGPSGSWDTNPDAIVGITYEARGSKTVQNVPLTLASQETVINTLADPSHGNNLLIITTVVDATNFQHQVIYEFNADTKQLTTLYSPKNWRDSQPKTAYTTPANTGFIWAGTHIYYTSTNGCPVSADGQTLYSAMYRLNDNGVTSKIYTVYGRLEPVTVSPASTQFSLFLGQ